MKKINIFLILISLIVLSSCQTKDSRFTYTSESPIYIGENQVLSTSVISMPSWMHDSVMYEVNIRQYTEEGTFKAFEDELPRLKQLGVEILWFMPIHEISLTNRNGTLGSYYAISDYYSINSEFGTLDDFDNLISNAHEMGFKIVMDIVFNHTGWDSPWIIEHPEYYLHVNGQITQPIGTNWYDVAELNTSRSDVIVELENVLYYWMSEHHVDGFRCDFANGVEKSTWEQLRDKVASLDENVFFLAEDNTRYDWFDTFNSNYGGWDLLSELNKVYSEISNKDDLINFLINQNRKYPIGSFPLNFITNHDINSWENTIENRFGNSKNVMTMLTFMLPGMPLIYSGQESSDEKMLEFFEKDLIHWNQYDEQPFLESLVSLKMDHPALFNNNFSNSTAFLHNFDSMILSFVRYDEITLDQVLVVANLSKYNLTQTIHLNHFMGTWYNLNHEAVNIDEFQDFTLGAYEYMIFTK